MCVAMAHCTVRCTVRRVLLLAVGGRETLREQCRFEKI